MARYKHHDYGQMKLVAVSYARQILPGTFEIRGSESLKCHLGAK